MLSSFSHLTDKELNELLRRWPDGAKKEFFYSTPSLSDILGLEQIDDYKERVARRWEYIHNNAEDVHWDHVEYHRYDKEGFLRFKELKVSTAGDIVLYNGKGVLRVYRPIPDNNETLRYQLITRQSHKMPVHRIVASTFIPLEERLEGAPYHRLVVNHKNYNEQDNKVSNLEWLTHSENSRHINHGFIDNYKIPYYYRFEVKDSGAYDGREFYLTLHHMSDLHMPLGWLIDRIIGKPLHDGKPELLYGFTVTPVLSYYDLNPDVAMGFPEDLLNIFLCFHQSACCGGWKTGPCATCRKPLESYPVRKKKKWKSLLFQEGYRESEAFEELTKRRCNHSYWE